MSTTPRPTTYPVDAQFTERWSPRAYTGEAIAEETLLSFLEAARWAPSASNIQPWRFIYALRDTPAWAPVFAGLVPFNQTWAKNASALVVVLSKKTNVPAGKTEAAPNPWHAFDAGAAWMSLALQAHAAGWKAHAAGGFDAKVLRANLGIADDHDIHAVVMVGRQGDKASLPEALQARELPSNRTPLAQLVAHGRFSFDA
jgi:nitroreductase